MTTWEKRGPLNFEEAFNHLTIALPVSAQQTQPPRSHNSNFHHLHLQAPRHHFQVCLATATRGV
jgi:hypothetical protein